MIKKSFILFLYFSSFAFLLINLGVSISEEIKYPKIKNDKWELTLLAVEASFEEPLSYYRNSGGIISFGTTQFGVSEAFYWLKLHISLKNTQKIDMNFNLNDVIINDGVSPWPQHTPSAYSRTNNTGPWSSDQKNNKVLNTSFSIPSGKTKGNS